MCWSLRQSEPRLLQLAVLGREGILWVETCVGSVAAEIVLGSRQVEDRDLLYQERRSNIFHRSQYYIFPDPNSSATGTLLKNKIYLSKVICFGLLTVSQVFTQVFTLVSTWAYRRGVYYFPCLDDWLVMALDDLFDPSAEHLA